MNILPIIDDDPQNIMWLKHKVTKHSSPNKEQGNISMLTNLEYSADDWWDNLSPDEKKAYVQAHPRSKYAKMPITTAPIKAAPKVLKPLPKKAKVVPSAPPAAAPNPNNMNDAEKKAALDAKVKQAIQLMMQQQQEEEKNRETDKNDKLYSEKELNRPLSKEEEEYNELYNKQHELEGLTPAVRDPQDGKIYTTPKGLPKGHLFAATMMPADAQKRLSATFPKGNTKYQFDGPHVGFLDRTGKFIPRADIDGGPVATEDVQQQIRNIRERKASISDEMRRFRQGGDDTLVAKIALAADAWWERMNAKEKKAYIAAHPRSKYARTPIAAAPKVAVKPKTAKTAAPAPVSDKQKQFDELLRKQRKLEGLRPALRDPKTGKVYIAPTGGTHGNAYDKMPPEVKKRFMKTNDEKNSKHLEYGGPHSGFVNSDGEFVSRNLLDDKRRWTTEEIEPNKYKIANDIRKFRDQEGDSLLISKLVELELSALRKFKELSFAEKKAYLKVYAYSIMV